MSESHEQWLALAENDLNFARVGSEHGFYAHVCFLAQQTVEKVLKGLLIAKTGKYPRLHSLVELVNECAKSVPDMIALEDHARILDQYYVPTRYPDGIPGSLPNGMPSESHAKEALRIAENFMETVRALLICSRPPCPPRLHGRRG